MWWAHTRGKHQHFCFSPLKSFLQLLLWLHFIMFNKQNVNNAHWAMFTNNTAGYCLTDEQKADSISLTRHPVIRILALLILRSTFFMITQPSCWLPCKSESRSSQGFVEICVFILSSRLADSLAAICCSWSWRRRLLYEPSVWMWRPRPQRVRVQVLDGML